MARVGLIGRTPEVTSINEWTTVKPKKANQKSRGNVVEDEKLLKENELIPNDATKDIEEIVQVETLLQAKESGHRRTDPQTFAECVKNVGKLLKCSECDCELESQGLLYAHMKTHKSNLPKCEICSDVFPNDLKLKSHLKETHDKPKFEEWNCNDCPFQAIHPSELMNHLKQTTHQPSPNVNDKKKLFDDYKRCYTCDL